MFTVSRSTPTSWSGPLPRPWSETMVSIPPLDTENPRNKWVSGSGLWSAHFWIWSRRPRAQGVRVDPCLLTCACTQLCRDDPISAPWPIRLHNLFRTQRCSITFAICFQKFPVSQGCRATLFTIGVSHLNSRTVASKSALVQCRATLSHVALHSATNNGAAQWGQTQCGRAL